MKISKSFKIYIYIFSIFFLAQQLLSETTYSKNIVVHKEPIDIKELKFQDFNFSKNNIENFDTKKIIFICGMPRSGTTLTEQIIASHQAVYGAGELNYLSKTIKKNRTPILAISSFL